MKRVQAAKYYSSEREKNFLNWMRNNNINKREKGLAIDQAQLKTYLKIPHYIDSVKTKFFNKIKDNSTLDEIFDCIEIDQEYPKQEYISIS